MFKRTNGYILLTLLVLTGFAGRVTNETLNSRERRFLITSLKENRTELLSLVKGLSDAQLDYRPSKDVPTIREHLYHIIASEKALGDLAQKALKQPATPAHLAKENDTHRALQIARDCHLNEYSPTTHASDDNIEKALDQFKEERAKAIKYIRTTTENVRAHTAITPSGSASVYQLYFGMSVHQARHTREMVKLIFSPGFPKK